MAKGDGLKISLDGEKYDINFDKVSLGEARMLKQRFGLTDFAAFNFFDPDQLVGIIAVAVKRAHPELSEEEVLEKVEGLENGPIFEALNKQVEEAIEKEADPLKAGANGSPPAGKASSRATPRKTPGVPSTPNS